MDSISPTANPVSSSQSNTPAAFLGSPDGRVHGWVSQPNSRGTIDIIWTSLATIFISTYVILCLNVPSRGESWWSITGRRLLWMGVSIAGPEFVLTAAVGQWAAAKRSVIAFKDAGHEDWTMRHAFFADMGGIEIRTPDFVPFRVNAKQLHYLVTKGYLPYPNILLDEISDKSKLDRIGKVITCAQITYLILQCIGRALQQLAITTLELFALAIVVCSIAISWCWLHKPADVKFPVKLNMDTSIGHILVEGGVPAARPYQQTPMDFVDDLCPSWSLNIQTFMNMPLGPFERPMPRFGNDRLPYRLEQRQNTALCLATLSLDTQGVRRDVLDWSNSRGLRTRDHVRRLLSIQDPSAKQQASRARSKCVLFLPRGGTGRKMKRLRKNLA